MDAWVVIVEISTVAPGSPLTESQLVRAWVEVEEVGVGVIVVVMVALYDKVVTEGGDLFNGKIIS